MRYRAELLGKNSQIVVGGFITQYSKTNNKNDTKNTRAFMEALGKTLIVLVCLLACVVALSAVWSTVKYCVMYFDLQCKAAWRLFRCVCLRYLRRYCLADTRAWSVPSLRGVRRRSNFKIKQHVKKRIKNGKTKLTI